MSSGSQPFGHHRWILWKAIFPWKNWAGVEAWWFRRACNLGPWYAQFTLEFTLLWKSNVTADLTEGRPQAANWAIKSTKVVIKQRGGRSSQWYRERAKVHGVPKSKRRKSFQEEKISWVKYYWWVRSHSNGKLPLNSISWKITEFDKRASGKGKGKIWLHQIQEAGGRQYDSLYQTLHAMWFVRIL